MKLKLCVLTALSLAGVALSAVPASAGWLHNKCCNRWATTIVCRPYNAFTPVCYGNLVCDGCCPFAFNPGMCGNCAGVSGDPIGLQAMQPMLTPRPALAMPNMSLPNLPMPNMPMHTMPVQQFQGPMPAPQQTQLPMTQPVMPAGYQQGYYPMYYGQMNPYQQVPAYWYGY